MDGVFLNRRVKIISTVKSRDVVSNFSRENP
jgi:hypothetical protein